MKHISIIFLLALSSCTLTKDFEFSFKVNDDEFSAIGTSAIPVVNGDRVKIMIEKAPFRRCTAILVDGDHHKKKNCKGKKGKYVTFDLGKVTQRTQKIVGLSVVRKGHEAMSGFLYLGKANAKYEPVTMEFTCPYQTEIENQFTCMRPENFGFTITAFAPGNGAMRIASADCAGSSFEQIYASVVDGEEIDFAVPNTIEGYCPIRVDFKNGRKITHSSTLHINFYSI